MNEAWETHRRLYVSHMQHAIQQCLLYVLFPIFQLYMLCILLRLLIIFWFEKCLDIEHGLPYVLTKPIRVLQVTQRGNNRDWNGESVGFSKTHMNTDGSTICTALILYSYCVRAGELAGDVECDEVFSNNYIRHTITIISNLAGDNTWCSITIQTLPHQDNRVTRWDLKLLHLSITKFNSLGQIHHQRPHI